MLKVLLIFACSCIAASTATTAAPKATVINIQNLSPDVLWIASDPTIDLAKPLLQVPTGTKLVPLTLPDEWEGELFVKSCQTTGTGKSATTTCDDTKFVIQTDIGNKNIRVGRTRLYFRNSKPSKYHFNIDYGYDYTMRMIPDAESTVANGVTSCDSLAAIAIDCEGVTEKLGDISVPFFLTADGKQCLTPCAALYNTKSILEVTKAKPLLAKYCAPDVDAAVDEYKKTNFYRNLISSGQKLASVNTTDSKLVDASCTATSYTLTISPRRGEKSDLETVNNGPFFNYFLPYTLA